MRVACSACGLEYSIPDHRVQGRRLKFRCKRCGTDVPVDGTPLGPPLPQSTPAVKASKPPGSTPVQIREPALSRPQPSTPDVQAPGTPRAASAGDPTPEAGTVISPPKAPAPPAAPVVRPVVRPPRPSSSGSHPRAAGPAAADTKEDNAPLSVDADALLSPSSRRPGHGKSWVVDLGSNVHETMSDVEICELYVRGTVTMSTPVRDASGGDWRLLSNVQELTQELLARGISLLPRLQLTASDDDAHPSESDFAAPTKQLNADQLWAAAGVKPSKREAEPEIHDAETAMIESRKLFEEAGLKRPLPSLKNAEDGSEDAETQLYSGPEKSAVPLSEPAIGSGQPSASGTPSEAENSPDRLMVARIAILAGALLLMLAIVLLIFVWPYVFGGSR